MSGAYNFGAGGPLANQTNINSDLVFFTPAGGGGTASAAENILVSSVTFNNAGTLPAASAGIVYASTASVLGASISSINFQNSAGVGEPVVVSSLCLKDGVSAGAIISQPSPGNLAFYTPIVNIKQMAVSSMQVSSINGLKPSNQPRSNVFYGSRLSMGAGGSDTISFPVGLFSQPPNIVCCGAGPNYPAIRPYATAISATGATFVGDANSFVNTICVGN